MWPADWARLRMGENGRGKQRVGAKETKREGTKREGTKREDKRERGPRECMAKIVAL